MTPPLYKTFGDPLKTLGQNLLPLWAPPGVEPVAQSDSKRENLQGPDIWTLRFRKLDFLGFLDVRSAFSSNCFCIDGGPIGGLEPGTSLIEERLQNHHKTIGPLLSNHLASCPISSHYVFTNTRPQVSYSTWKVIYRTQFHSNITISGRS